jgi:hypothetical protein
MSDDNKRNLLYFEAPSMKELYNLLETWQDENKKRFLSLSIEKDRGGFCCIGLTNPSEVVIVDGTYVSGGVDVSSRALKVYT